MKPGLLSFIVVLAASVLLCSCKGDANVITSIDGIDLNAKNFLDGSNSKNSFSVKVNAELFNKAQEYTVTFDKAQFVMVTSVSNLTKGDVSIQIFNDTKQMLYTADFTTKTELTQTINLEEIPKKVKFIFNNLSADFVCSLNVK